MSKPPKFKLSGKTELRIYWTLHSAITGIFIGALLSLAHFAVSIMPVISGEVSPATTYDWAAVGFVLGIVLGISGDLLLMHKGIFLGIFFDKPTPDMGDARLRNWQDVAIVLAFIGLLLTMSVILVGISNIFSLIF